MRIERWYWLLAFCVFSVLLHLTVGYATRSLKPPTSIPQVTYMDVTLEQPQPAPEPKPEPPKPEPPKPEIAKKVETRPTPSVAAVKHVRPSPVNVPSPKAEPKETAHIETLHPETRPLTQPKGEPGGIKPKEEQIPVPVGLASGKSSEPAPAVKHDVRAVNPGGGGSLSPSPIPNGKNGASTPEAPTEKMVYNGGGRGGKTPNPPDLQIGGGGGNILPSVDNPLAKITIPEAKPGQGPGRGGDTGSGSGGGIGSAGGPGIGTSLKGSNQRTFNPVKGNGLGNGQGDKNGTRPPGGGTGTGSDEPGTGGRGHGYGRNNGFGTGTGSGVGGGTTDGGGLGRGIPFGDVAGVLGGSKKSGGGTGGGPGGPGRGGVFGTGNRGGGHGALHIVYCLDVSGSMRDGNKIGKAKEELKRAVSQLKPTDSFDIIAFARNTYRMWPVMVQAAPDIIEETLRKIDELRLADGTNISLAMEQALSLDGITDVYLMSDGEPNGGIQDFGTLRDWVKANNNQKAHINTLGLCLGEEYKGAPLMKGIAEDNGGVYKYINLATVR